MKTKRKPAQQKFKTIQPVRVSREDFDRLEARIKRLFKEQIYFPVLKSLDEPRDTLKNSSGDEGHQDLIDALFRGRITFYRGVFSGRLSAGATRTLKQLGARWDRTTGTFSILFSRLPPEIQAAVSASESNFKKKLDRIDQRLKEILPDELADKLKAQDLFDSTLWKTEREFQRSVKNITLAPKLTQEQSARISAEWENNMRLYIKDFTESEIRELRAKVRESVQSGARYESIIKSIQDSYLVSANKAKFLARQESSLMISKFTETRYADAGIHEYTWHSVIGSPHHPVRPRHKALNDASARGEVFRFDDPPVTSEPGQAVRRNNPGQDYNCRCFARPIVRF